ncbi:MAG TPA: FAD-dependent oxidoreductase [Bacteroidales bacterium]|nr:CoB--CoM heterodisulfide reductase iron-sulfur subunit A family protein [Bacteroidales bacterium]HOU95798.1 FAD-dependent oxidoreductase [Bacteroidales bacterium]
MGNVVVIGAGVAGLEVAGQLALSGYKVTVAEKGDKIGGNLSNWHHLFPNRRNGDEVLNYLKKLVNKSDITILTGTEISNLSRKDGKIHLSFSKGDKLEADAVVIATGFDLFDSRQKEEYGYGLYDNVISSADLERMYKNGEVRMTNWKIPEKVGFIHCVGSRDEKIGNLYCSKLCCVTAVKQAIEICEKIKNVKAFCFYMDMRMSGAFYEELYREAQEKYGISFIRGKVSEISENIKGKLVVKVEDTLAGRPLKMELDMVVLMAGIEMSKSGEYLADNSSLRRGGNRFFLPVDNHFGNNVSNMKGVFYAGCCVAPMNITESISHARAAVNEVINYLRNLS